jgi:hypothetical protein
MFCPKCGTQNPETGRFCRNCGANLGNVSEALSGNLQKSRNLVDKKGKPIDWEGAIVKIFTGLAFLIVAAVLGITGIAGGKFWWFWMLIPAFGSLGSGVAQFIQLKKSEKNNVLISARETNQTFAPVSNAALSSSQTNYVKPQKSIYDTGELAAPPSVVEGTTKHLEMNSEGETMTLPKTER